MYETHPSVSCSHRAAVAVNPALHSIVIESGCITALTTNTLGLQKFRFFFSFLSARFVSTEFMTRTTPRCVSIPTVIHPLLHSVTFTIFTQITNNVYIEVISHSDSIRV